MKKPIVLYSEVKKARVKWERLKLLQIQAFRIESKLEIAKRIKECEKIFDAWDKQANLY